MARQQVDWWPSRFSAEMWNSNLTYMYVLIVLSGLLLCMLWDSFLRQAKWCDTVSINNNNNNNSLNYVYSAVTHHHRSHCDSPGSSDGWWPSDQASSSSSGVGTDSILKVLSECGAVWWLGLWVYLYAAIVYIHHCHLLLLSLKADTHFTVPWRVEGWVKLRT